MNALLIAFLLVLVVPLMTATWRMSLLGLAVQGLLLGWIAFRKEESLSPNDLILVVEFVLIRGVFAPRYLYGIMRSRNIPARNDVIPANLLSWAVGGALILLAFRVANLVAAKNPTHLGVAASAVLLGFLVLATQDSPFSQMVGLLRIENGIALFELSSPNELPIAVEGGLAVVFFVSVLFLGMFLRRLFGPAADAPAGAAL